MRDRKVYVGRGKWKKVVLTARRMYHLQRQGEHVTRARLRAFFETPNVWRGACVTTSDCYDGREARYVRGVLRFGCCWFTRAQTRVIRRWALGRGGHGR